MVNASWGANVVEITSDTTLTALERVLHTRTFAIVTERVAIKCGTTVAGHGDDEDATMGWTGDADGMSGVRVVRHVITMVDLIRFWEERRRV